MADDSICQCHRSTTQRTDSVIDMEVTLKTGRRGVPEGIATLEVHLRRRTNHRKVWCQIRSGSHERRHELLTARTVGKRRGAIEPLTVSTDVLSVENDTVYEIWDRLVIDTTLGW